MNESAINRRPRMPRRSFHQAYRSATRGLSRSGSRRRVFALRYAGHARSGECRFQVPRRSPIPLPARDRSTAGRPALAFGAVAREIVRHTRPAFEIFVDRCAAHGAELKHVAPGEARDEPLELAIDDPDRSARLQHVGDELLVRRTENQAFIAKVRHSLDHQTILTGIEQMMERDVGIGFDKNARRLPRPLQILHRFVGMHAGSADRHETRLRQPRYAERRAKMDERAVG